MQRQLVWSGVAASVICCLAGNVASAQTVEFNRDVRPILSNHCFVCHGPDSNLRKAKLRLDDEKSALADRGGYQVLVPGKPAESELYKRITAANVKERMPPVKHQPLAKAQVDVFRRWIEQGANYQKHWSLIAAQRPPLPKVKTAGWGRNGIDAFILARLEQERLQPSKEADRRILIRRLSFDLTGLPPTPAEVDAFLADADGQAYEKLVDRLLSSKHFGERMAQYWLDLVRYADTGGYHSDNHRDVFLYRDYVIQAFNDNVPFDRFIIEQLAGDLLPNPTSTQKIASGYNRMLQTTEEGGAQPREYQAKYYADRVRNAGTVWLGMTLGCIECHDHKFDPFTAKEFYKFAAFFADLKEKSVGRQDQTAISTPEQDEKLRQLDAAMGPLQKILASATPELDAAQARWEEAVRAKGTKGLPKEIVAIFAVDKQKWTMKQKEALATYYRASVDPGLAEPRGKLAELQKQKADLVKAIPSALVSVAMAPRTMKVLPRGNWLDDSGEVVLPDVPASLGRLAVGERRATRHDLARWLIAPENPLTARVFVNRLWMLLYGQGIVKTLDDFGNQGAWPTHPDLLDWLAVEFRESGWDVRHMIKLMVTSSTYRQVSTVTAELKQKDPYNVLLARQARWRLDAEFVRDNALAVSGLLVPKVGGPSVKPYQPAGYWAYLNFPKRDWFKDAGESQYRRGLYTYWQRTFLHPSLLAFDASTREECTVERTRSNIPQQALVLLNDPTYVEASRVFAERLIREGGQDAESRVQHAYRLALNRKAQPAEVKILTDLYERHRQQYDGDKGAAEKLLKVGDRPTPADIAPAELAAWTSVARVILNLHETITRN